MDKVTKAPLPPSPPKGRKIKEGGTNTAWLINRIGLLLFTMINVIVLLTLALVSPRWYSIYQAYSTEKVFKFLYGKDNKI